MDRWWTWWLKWWVWSGVAFFVIILFSEPPRLWFWLVLFVLVLIYGLERSLNA